MLELLLGKNIPGVRGQSPRGSAQQSSGETKGKPNE